MATTTTFIELNRKQVFNGLVKEVLLEPRKPSTVLDSYRDDGMEYLGTEMDKILRAKGRGTQFCWSVQVKTSTTLLKTIDYDEEESCVAYYNCI